MKENEMTEPLERAASPVQDRVAGSDQPRRPSLEMLFRPTELGSLRIPNRLVMAPMTRSRGTDARPHPAAPLYYAQRAGAGLMVTEGICVSPSGAGAPGVPGIWNDQQTDDWRQVTAAVRQSGGRVVAQLWHHGRAALPEHLPEGAPGPVGPSAIAIDTSTYVARRRLPFAIPTPLSRDGIAEVVAEHLAAAARARTAGFDGVEIHAANGYLIDQFLHASSNRRSDEYGGSPFNRTQLLMDVTAAVVMEWGSGRVGVRLSPSSTFQDMHDPQKEEVFDTALHRLDSLPLAYVHLVEPGISGALSTSPVDGRGDGAGVRMDAGWARSRTRHPIVATGDHTRASAARVVTDGHADALGFGRSFLANPDLARRFAEGAKLNEADRQTLYGGGEHGYIDYPSLEAQRLLDRLRHAPRSEVRAFISAQEALSGATPAALWERAWAADRLRRARPEAAPSTAAHEPKNDDREGQLS